MGIGDWILVGILGVSVGAALVIAWHGVCNQRTYRQRTRLLENNVNLGPRYLDLFWREWHSVEYNEHLMALFWGRNPQELYGPVVNYVWNEAYTLTDDGDFKPEPLVEDNRAYLAAITGESQ